MATFTNVFVFLRDDSAGEIIPLVFVRNFLVLLYSHNRCRIRNIEKCPFVSLLMYDISSRFCQEFLLKTKYILMSKMCGLSGAVTHARYNKVFNKRQFF